MDVKRAVSRRGFVGGVAGTLGYLTLSPAAELWAQTRGRAPETPAEQQQALDEYDAFAKLSFNENPYGPFDSAMKAMQNAFKYSPRYGYPDGNLVAELAKHHNVKAENILLGAGSGEILNVVGMTFLQGGKKVVGVEPSYNAVYSHASGIKADAIKLPLLADYRQDIPAMIKATKRNYREVGFVYMCNPNNPTGRIVTKAEIRQLLDGIPEDMPVLIDEAYHHFVNDPDYATSVPYVIEGRPVIIARTFSKIAGLAGLRLGYAVAPAEIVRRMQPWSVGSINALVKWAGVTSLKDTVAEARMKKMNTELRDKTVAELKGMGYEIIPSETNFFMVNLRRPLAPVSDEFRKRGVLVGRAFPPLVEHMRVSIGTPEEMGRFMKAWKEIMPARAAARSG